MSKHSPGPWQWNREDGSVDTDDGPICFINTRKSYSDVKRTGEEYSHANARLIAAAPELLEALNRETGAHTPDCPCESCALIRRIEGKQ